MSGRELIALTSAKLKKRRGHPTEVVTSRPTRKWSGRHQALLRRAFKNPAAEIDLAADLTDRQALALGLEPIRAIGVRSWTSPDGDELRDLIILGLEPPIAQEVEQKPTAPVFYLTDVPGQIIIEEHRGDDPLATPVFGGKR